MVNTFTCWALVAALAMASGCDVGLEERRRRAKRMESVEPEALPPPRAAAPVERAAAPAAPEGPPIEVSPEQLRKDYKANEVSADERYRGKALLVTGKIKAIKKDFLANPYLELSTSEPYEAVWAHFDKDAIAALGRLTTGTKVTVLCIGNNVVIGNPQLKDCALQ